MRVDYRNGDDIDGWTGNAGIRYQFTPETIAAVLPTKAPKSPIPVIGVTNWTGFYAGGFFGAAGGRTDIAFPASPRRPTGRGYSDRSAASSSATIPVQQQLGPRHRGRHQHHNVMTAAAQRSVTVPVSTSAFFGLSGQTSSMATSNRPSRLYLTHAR